MKRMQLGLIQPDSQKKTNGTGDKSTSTETDNLFNMKRPVRHSAYIPTQSRFFRDIFEPPPIDSAENK